MRSVAARQMPRRRPRPRLQPSEPSWCASYACDWTRTSGNIACASRTRDSSQSCAKEASAPRSGKGFYLSQALPVDYVKAATALLTTLHQDALKNAARAGAL
jgi:hypothetical protein